MQPPALCSNHRCVYIDQCDFCEKVYFDQLLDFSILLFIIPSYFNIVTHLSLRMQDFLNTIRVSNSMDPDQAQRFVGPDLGPNCLQRLSADDKSRR